MKVKVHGINCEVEDQIPQVMHENEEEPVAAYKSEGCGTADHPVTIDEVFSDHVGNFGRGQILHFLLTSLGWMLQALHILVPVFAERSPVWNYNLNTNSNVSNGHGHTLLLCAPICTDYTVFNKRLGEEFMFHLPTAISVALNDSTVIRSSAPPCSASDSSWSWLDKKESTISEWNLVCDRVYLQGFAQSAFFIGSIVGSSVFGHLSDSKLGRRGALAFSTISLCVFDMLTAVSPNYQLYILLRALTGASTGGLAVSSYVLGMELIGPSCRATVALSSLYFFPIGSFLLVAVASAYRMLASGSYNWRYLYVVTSIPSVLYCLSVLPFINESPRWYLVHGHTDKAMEVLLSISNQNGRNFPKGLVLVTCHRSRDVLGATGNRAQQDGSLVQVFKRRDTRYRMLIVVVSWFACALGYYVFNLNVGNLGTNLYLSVMLNAMVEIAGYAVATILVHRIGRRYSLVSKLILGSVTTLSGAVVSSSLIKLSSFSPPGITVPILNNLGGHVGTVTGHTQAQLEMRRIDILGSASSYILSSTAIGSYIQLACTLIGLFCLSGAYNILYFYGSELFPTTVRNAAVSFAYQGGSMGSILAPLVVTLAQVNSSIPYFIIGATSLVSGLIAIKLPETMNTQLYESFEDMDTISNEV